MLTCPKASIMPSWARMRLATASSWRSLASLSVTERSLSSGCRRRQQNIGHIARLRGEHVLSGHDLAAAAAGGFEQRREDWSGDEIRNVYGRLKPRRIDGQGIGRLHSGRRR